MQPHATRGNGPSTEDLMAIFLNRLVEEVLALLGPSHIQQKWSAEFCQKVLPGSAEDRKPDIILVDADLPEDWHNLTTVGEMKKSSIDVKNLLWFDEGAKWANTMCTSQDSHTFTPVLQFLGAQFTFVFFDRGESVCLDVLGIHKDSEEYFRLVLYLSLAHRGVYMHKSMCFPNMTIVGTGLLGFDPTIVHDPKSDCCFIQTKLFGKVPIDMVLFISNNLNGRGTVIRRVTLPKDQINQALKNGLNSEALQKWLKGMADMESIVVKDTWLDLAMPHMEGMVLNYLRLKGVQGVTRSLFEGLVLVSPAFVPPALALKYKEAQALPWQSTVHNQLSWNVPTLALAHHSLTSSLKAHDAKHDQGLECMDQEVYQEHILTRHFLYPLCAPIYEFSCVYEALMGVMDCIWGGYQQYLALAATECITQHMVKPIHHTAFQTMAPRVMSYSLCHSCKQIPRCGTWDLSILTSLTGVT